MKENTKYNNYRFAGKMNIEEIQPWFDFDRSKPWDEREVPWSLENKVRREILIKLANHGPQTFSEIHQKIKFSPKPLLITKEEHSGKVSFQWSKSVVKNHLLNLEYYDLIKKRDNKYEVTFPVLTMDKLENLEKYIEIFAKEWIKVIKDTKEEIMNQFQDIIRDEKSFYQILMEKTIEKLYQMLKQEKFLPKESNIKTLWAEQLREIKFEKWLEINF